MDRPRSDCLSVVLVFACVNRWGMMRRYRGGAISTTSWQFRRRGTPLGRTSPGGIESLQQRGDVIMLIFVPSCPWPMWLVAIRALPCEKFRPSSRNRNSFPTVRQLFSSCTRYHFIVHDKGKPNVSLGRKVMGPHNVDRQTADGT